MTIKDIRPALRGFLLAGADVSAAVGGVRIYPVKMPQGMLQDSVVYNRISGQGDHKMDGPSGLSRPRIQLDAWSQSHDGAAILANKVKERLDGYRGPMAFGSNSPQDFVVVQGVFFDSERDNFDEVSKLYGVSRDYFFWVEER